jgi:hypothetical protein
VLFNRGFAIVGRVAVIAGGLLLALAAGWAFGIFLGSLPLPTIDAGVVERFLEALRADSLRGALAAAAAASLATLGVALAILGARGSARVVVLPMPHREQGEPGGTVAVSKASIRALGRRCAEQLEGVTATASAVRLLRDGWHIDLRLTVDPDLNVPDAVTKIRSNLAETLERQTGVSLSDLRVRAEAGRRQVVPPPARVH